MSKPCLSCGAHNVKDAKFCRACGKAFATVDVPSMPAVASARPIGTWIGLVAIVALIAIAFWWIMNLRPSVATGFDAAPPPSVTAPTASAVVVPDSPPASAPEIVASAPARNASAAVQAVARSSSGVPGSAASAPAGKSSGSDRATRDAKARALREQRRLVAAQATADAARQRQRAEQLRARPVPTAPPIPAAQTPAFTVAPPRARTVQEICTSGNTLMRAICEARECVHRAHSGEAACERVRAAEDRRNQQN